MPDTFVQVTRDHSNDSHNNTKKVRAFAKIAGKDWTLYIKTLSISIGRATEGVYPPDHNGIASRDEGSLSAPETENSRIDIDLGPDKHVSRLHAEIFFDGQGDEEGAWYIHVNGRNPIKVDETTVRKGEKMKLRCGHVIEIAGVQMLFSWPGEEMRIMMRLMVKAGLGKEDQSPDQNPPEQTVPGRAYPAGPGGPSYPTPIAPAPPDYRRAGTPVKRGRNNYNSTPRGGGYGNGTMMMATDQLDLSLESNQHIKPNYSYAQLITQAILDAGESCTLNKIYEHIMKHYSYYRNPEGQMGWQVSLSLQILKCTYSQFLEFDSSQPVSIKVFLQGSSQL